MQCSQCRIELDFIMADLWFCPCCKECLGGTPILDSTDNPLKMICSENTEVVDREKIYLTQVNYGE